MATPVSAARLNTAVQSGDHSYTRIEHASARVLIEAFGQLGEKFEMAVDPAHLRRLEWGDAGQRGEKLDDVDEQEGRSCGRDCAIRPASASVMPDVWNDGLRRGT